MTTADLFTLKGKTALVTGGSRGLGLAFARALASHGARVAITARKRDELDLASAELARAGLEVLAVENDLSQVDAIPAMVDAVVGAFGPIDILVNNAGTTWGAPAAEHTFYAWKKVMDVNLNGTWVLSQTVARQCMLPRKSGSIVIVASVMGLGGNMPGSTPTVAYNASKAAQINLARSLAAEWGTSGVRVNALLPGWFPTKMTTGTLHEHSEGFERRIPLGRLGDDAQDLAGPIVFLASDASRYVTGHALTVDGGLSTVF